MIAQSEKRNRSRCFNVSRSCRSWSTLAFNLVNTTFVPTCRINRYYDPSTDSFISVDPAVQATDQPYVFVNSYSERLGEAGVVASVGSRGDSYDNALAESFNGLYKNELIHRKGPWRNVEHVEWATLNYVDWFNNRRIHEALDYVPPATFEAHYYESNESDRLAVLETI